MFEKKKEEEALTGVILDTKSNMWEVLYKGLSFGKSSNLVESVDKLEQIYDLDDTRTNRLEEARLASMALEAKREETKM